ncbi:MAG TPA: MBL fold metallo-hydrolase [Thermomicrobiales bacterium]|nr:MBL fold metallo-hydrolase [Thermomicrobiales bacterium]
MTSGDATRYVESRRCGDAIVTAISEATGPYRVSLAVPEAEWRRELPHADAEGRLPYGQHVVHIRLGDASILVDPGLDDPESAWGRRHAAQSPDLARTPGVLAGLASIGVRPEEITHVVITHAHFDHVVGATVERDGGLAPRYPRARYLLGRADREGLRDQPDSDMAVRLAVIERHGLLDLVDGDREVAPGVTMLHAPGETPGHAVVRVVAGDARCYALGDLFHDACEVAHLDWAAPWVDLPAMRASRERLLAEAVPAGAALVFTHALFPPWGRIGGGADTASGYRWETIDDRR